MGSTGFDIPEYSVGLHPVYAESVQLVNTVEIAFPSHADRDILTWVASPPPVFLLNSVLLI
jgi:hypothetical protein